jgi:serine/threonine protein kinase
VPISVTCTACQKSFSVPDHYAGRQGKCTQCGAPMVATAAPVGAAVGSPVALTPPPQAPAMPHMPAMSGSGESAFTRPSGSGVAAQGPAPQGQAPAQGDGAIAIGSQLGQFRLQKKLGDPKSMVFLADGPKGRVALKVLPEKVTSQYPTAAKRFLREARSLFGLSHPNVPAVLDAGEELGCLFLAMEYFDGARTVRELLDEKKTLPVTSALSIAAQTGRALVHLGEHKLVHRNVKPEHILVDAAGTVKLCGLGLVKGAESEQALTVKGHVVGTPQYMSPEHARGEQDVDATSDLWSLGVTLYELLAGEPPWNDKNPMRVLQAIATQPPPPLATKAPSTPAPVVAVVEKLLAKERPQRYDSAAELVTDLAAIEEGTLVAGKPPSFSKGAKPTRGTGTVVVGGGAASGDAMVKKLVVMVGVLAALVVVLLVVVLVLALKK